MNAKQPLLSIVTPSYNQGDFIEDLLRSVRDQAHDDVEHIIVDGGSTDNTLEMLRKYEHMYNLRWISEPDKGQSDAIQEELKAINERIEELKKEKQDKK